MTVDAPEAASRTTARPGFRPGTARAVRVAALVVVGGLGLVVAFWHISRQTPYVDEFTYIGSGWDYVHGALGDNLQHPPTAKYLFGLVQLVTGQGVLGPRLLSAAASFGTGLVLLAWLRRTVGSWGALLAAGLYPTFGGLVLRGAFATGGMAFLTHQPLWLAYGLGAAVGALTFGGVLGLFAVAANRPLRPRLRRVGYGALAFLTLWLGAILIG
ncbi:MAG: hypothetical protein V4737_08940, partial [Curtobacterium sp.]